MNMLTLNLLEIVGMNLDGNKSVVESCVFEKSWNEFIGNIWNCNVEVCMLILPLYFFFFHELINEVEESEWREEETVGIEVRWRSLALLRSESLKNRDFVTS
ncbi:hypothetical protein RYX36_002270 [Vicia faba]